MKKLIFSALALAGFALTVAAADYQLETAYAKISGTNNVVAGSASSNLVSRPIMVQKDAPTLAVQVSAVAAAANSGNLICTWKQSVNGKDFVSSLTTTNALSGNTTNSTLATVTLTSGVRWVQLTSVTNSGPSAGFVTNLTVTAGYFH
jgi:hypothetical protein